MFAFDPDYRPRLTDLRPIVTAPARLLAEAAERLTPADAFQGRRGYDPAFLAPFDVALPVPGAALAGDILPVTGDPDGQLDYMHFSVVMSRSRRLAVFTAVNIDGANAVSVPRGGDPWALDARIPADAQIGDALYSDNDFDRGHLVRREDPNWGSEAATANRDTFHFTNCAPQLSAFNQETWLSLEDFILSNTKRWKERAMVFTGPIFAESDPEYRGVRIPLAYWKVVAFLDDAGKPSASGYTIEQDVDVGGMSLIFGPFKTYQRSLLSIAQQTGLRFGGIDRYDGFSNEARATGAEIRRVIKTSSDLRL
ncbi:MAG TPA: DNA/RNA non-specific endonuclease [Sphingomonas sp.]|jgi:endonuclease G|uniref:DNA/RNA non-specific endonuclease n=1 Tax=Sphingomonas sp. TaxID=28214 RepID=UPI002ED7EC97